MDRFFAYNVGSTDRVIRVILGLIVLSLVFAGPHTPWGWLGLIALLTGFAGICPLYRLLGISTRHQPYGDTGAV